MSKTRIPQFETIEQLNAWIFKRFSFDGDNPLEQLLEDYDSAKEILYGMYALIDKRERRVDFDSASLSA
ncbi:MAG: hypothetical protein M1486_01725 [Gammaproteobacteria bacterium]|nr:hypothetical protein [Gammaproteobacteria bacterium]